MKIELSIADDDLIAAERHVAIRASLVACGMSDVTPIDRIVGMVLGAAKAAGWGKRRRKKA